MTAQTWVSIILAVISAGALFFTARAANASRRQTKLHHQIRQDGAQPYLWADLRPDEAQGGLLLLLVGNSGPTIATDVVVTFDPPLKSTRPERTGMLGQLGTKGISSITPGRIMTWSLGAAIQHMSAGSPSTSYSVFISAKGPFGPIETGPYQIDLGDLKFTKAPKEGSMHLIAQSIAELTKAVRSGDS